MRNIRVSSALSRLIKSGQKRLPADSLKGKDFEGIAVFSEKNGNKLGYGYLSLQNNGLGWFVSPDHQSFDQDFFITLFQKAKARRTSFEQNQDTTAYRLFNQDGDGFGGFSVDRYGDFAVFSWYNAFVKKLQETIIVAFREVWPEIVGAYEKNRLSGYKGEISSHLFGQEQSDPFLVTENGVSYSVFLDEGWMTGIFLDQHKVRQQLVDGLAKGKSLLNLFSYSAAFSVAAKSGGAKETVSVDLAKRSRALSQAHFDANDFDVASDRFVVMDCFEYLRYAKRHNLTFDVIVIDPPSFARNKKQTFSVAKNYHQLIEGALEVLSDNGVIIASTNSANLSKQQFKQELDKGFGKISHQYVNLYQLPEDYPTISADPQSNYLKVYMIKVTK